jgi:Zn-dependent peptidase ImmA (M78 family)
MPILVEPRLVYDEFSWNFEACLIDTNKLIELKTEGASLRKLAAYFGCSRVTIKRRLNNLGIST